MGFCGIGLCNSRLDLDSLDTYLTLDTEVFRRVGASLVLNFNAYQQLQGNDPSCFCEFLMPVLSSNISSGNSGLQILDKNWGAGWNLLSLLLVINPYERIRMEAEILADPELTKDEFLAELPTLTKICRLKIRDLQL